MMSANSLPDGWHATTIGEIRVDRSTSINPSKHETETFELYSIPAYPSGRPEVVTGSKVGSTKKSLEPGTVVVSKINPRINRVWVVGERSEHRQVGSSEWIPFFPLEGLDPKYLAYFMHQDAFRNYLAANVSGVGGSLMRVKPSTVDPYPLVLAPGPEQHLIVEAIDSYFSRLDDAVATLERAQRNLKRYRASVLKAAVEGRLVPTEAELARAEGREYEPASVLLERILAERRRRWEEAELARMQAKGKVLKDDKWKARYKNPAGIDLSEMPTIPEGWSWVRAEQVCEFITKGTTPRAELMSQGTGDVPYIKVYNLTFDGRLDFSVDPTFVGLSTHRGLLARSLVIPGDVLTNIVGPPLGKVSLIPSTYAEWNINQAIARFRSLHGLLANYLAVVLSSTSFLQWAKRRSKATAGQFNLTLEICRDAPIPLPPTSEQARIVEEAARIMDLATHASDSCRSNQARCSRLRQSILKWAFEGRLVDQDSADEPASRLLERIQAERESTNGHPRRGPRRPRARSPKA